MVSLCISEKVRTSGENRIHSPSTEHFLLVTVSIEREIWKAMDSKDNCPLVSAFMKAETKGQLSLESIAFHISRSIETVTSKKCSVLGEWIRFSPEVLTFSEIQSETIVLYLRSEKRRVGKE